MGFSVLNENNLDKWIWKKKLNKEFSNRYLMVELFSKIHVGFEWISGGFPISTSL